MSQVDTDPIDALRIPHHSFEVDSSPGALLMNNAAISLVEGLIHPRNFYRFEYKTIFQAIQNLIAKSKPAEVITGLQSKGEEEGSRGLTCLNTLAQYVPNAANIARHTDIVWDKSVLRSLIAASDNIASDNIASDTFARYSKSVADQLVQAEQRILCTGASDNPCHESQSLSTLVQKFNELLLKRVDNPGKLISFATGQPVLDR